MPGFTLSARFAARFRSRIIASIAFLSALVFVMPLGGCSLPGGSQASSASSSSLKTVTFMLDWAPDTNHVGVYVAKHQGLYEAAGISVDVLATSQAGADQAVDAGSADFALSTLNNVAVADSKGAQNKMVLDVQQKPSAVWCALASNTSITRPRDLDGKIFASFGSSEDDAVIRRMIQTDGGAGTFDKVMVGTSTFETMTSGQADFGGFYDTWEGVESRLDGPALTCFWEHDYGVPGNGQQIGIITNQSLIDSDPDTVRAFVQATKQGYEWAYAHPNDAAQILVDEAADANIDINLAKASMKEIVDDQYWGDPDAMANGSFTLGSFDYEAGQEWLDFQNEAGAYEDADGNALTTAPQARDLANDTFLK